MKKIALLALCAFLAVPLSFSHASAITVPERLVYDVSWTGLSAGTTVQEVSGNGDELRIVSTTRSNGWMNAFYSIDDRTESIISRGQGSDFGTPKSYREKLKEGRYRAQKEARFDPESLKVETKDLIKKTEKTEAIGPRTFDSLSVIYYIRSMDLEPGKTLHVNIYDCKRLWKSEVQVLRREEIDTPVGRFKTLVVHPVLHAEGFKGKPADVTVWVTDDALRIPVKMSTKMKVGRINANLVGGSYWPTVAEK
jgi:hypothetical protein